MYQALYRKYRPKQFVDVVGQEHITTTLKNEIAASRPSHAYLLMGSRGTGKTTCAKIVSKAVNCLNLTDGDPCGNCDICKGIDNGSITDVLEIDAASNSGVENIRELREEANFLPAMAKYRVYIIDEVHALSPGAVNALLKIMEEPPAHVIFILATTEVHKIPATIQSRCQRFDFKRIPSDVIAQRLDYICKKEDLNADYPALELIGKVADGGMRDALSLLDLASSHSTDITIENVSHVTGLVQQDYLFDLADSVIAQDYSKALEVIDNANDLSIEYDRLCHQLISHYRNLLIAGVAKNPEKLIVCLPEVLEKYTAQAKSTNPTQMLYITKILQETTGVMLTSHSRRTDMELCFAKLCNPKLSQSSEALLLRIEELEATLNGIKANGVTVQSAPSPTPTAPTAPAVPAAATTPVVPVSQTATQQPTPAPVSQPVKRVQAPPPADGNTPETAMDNWEEVLERLGKINKALRGALLESTAYICGKRILIDCKNPVFVELMRNNADTKETLKKAIQQTTGETYSIGPYQKKNTTDSPVAVNQTNSIDTLLNKARDSGVPVEII